MKINWKAINWLGLAKAVIKAVVPFLSGAVGGFLSGCSQYGTGVGVTI